MKKCDVIIPIYNDYDCTIECIESVLKNTKFNGNYLILINNLSSDKRIKPLLEKYAKKYKQIIHLENKEDLGFFGTINRGMKYSKNDVLLLEPNTEVTKNWLDKICKCAYSSNNIATVTPLSNNTTFESAPGLFELNNSIPEYSLEQMGKLVEDCSNNYYPEIPIGHILCFFIKREILNKVGYFDQVLKGYESEIDFCFRCYEFGYRHVLCDDTYIFHKETESFLELKENCKKKEFEVLKEKYSKYKQKLNLWVQSNPIDYIGINIALTIGNIEERPNILFIIHDWKTNIGGTTLHARDLIDNMRDKFNFHVFTFENGIYKVYSYFRNVETSIVYPKISVSMKTLNYFNKEYYRILFRIVDDFKISFVHIHHLINHYFDVCDVLCDKKIKYMITLHDYYCQCPLINKIYKGEEYCGNPSTKQCNDCLYYIYKEKIDIQSWKENWERLLQNSNYVITPSESTKYEILDVYKNINITVIEHGIDIKKSESKLDVNDEYNDIAFLGAIGIHKGSRILDRFIEDNMLNNSKVHLFGITSSKINKCNEHYIDHGAYTRDKLKELLQRNNIKLICLFSIWPETYSYTMTEAIACGIPVISYDFGAIAERIKKYNLGWVINTKATPEEISNFINKIFSSSKKYKDVIESINQYKIISTKKMAKNYEKIYEKNSSLRGKILFNSDYLKDINQCRSKEQNLDITQKLVEIEMFKKANKDLEKENDKLNAELSKIYNSKGFRILGKVYEIKNKIFRSK